MAAKAALMPNVTSLHLFTLMSIMDAPSESVAAALILLAGPGLIKKQLKHHHKAGRHADNPYVLRQKQQLAQINGIRAEQGREHLRLSPPDDNSQILHDIGHAHRCNQKVCK